MRKAYRIEDRRIIETSGDDASILVYVRPSEEEQRELVARRDIDEHSLASSLDPDEPARFEMDSNHATFIFKRPKNLSAKERFLFRVASMGLFLYGDRLIVILADDIPLFVGKPFAAVETVQETFLKLLFSGVRHYLDHLKVINQISEEIEGLVSVSMENKHLFNLFTLEKSLVYYLSAINANSFALDRLKLASAKLGLNPACVEVLDDLIIENNQCYRQAEIHSNILASLMDARVSIVSNNLNILMKTLNLVTIFIMVPTFVVSAFSMNIDIPFEHHPKAFWIVLALSTFSVIVVVLWWNAFSAKLTRSAALASQS